MTVIVHVLFEQTQPLPEVLAPPIFALNYGRALHMAYGDEDKSSIGWSSLRRRPPQVKENSKSRRTSILLVRNRQCLFPYWRQHSRLAGEHLLPQGHKGSKGRRPPPKRTSNIRIQSKPIGNALGRCQRENVVARVTSKRGRKGWERVLRMSLICCTLPFRSLLPPIRPSSQRKRGEARENGLAPARSAIDFGRRWQRSNGRGTGAPAAKME